MINFFLRLRFRILTQFKQYGLPEDNTGSVFQEDWEMVRWIHRHYSMDMVSFENGICSIRTDGNKEGCIITKEVQPEGGGSTRAMIKFSSSPGAWSGFWTLDDVKEGSDYKILPEYDFEHCGSWKHMITTTLHYGRDYGKDLKSSRHTSCRGGKKFTPTTHYYMYEIDWNPFRTLWKINGITVRRETRGCSTNARKALLSMSFGNYCQKQITSLTEPTKIKMFNAHILEQYNILKNE